VRDCHTLRSRFVCLVRMTDSGYGTVTHFSSHAVEKRPIATHADYSSPGGCLWDIADSTFTGLVSGYTTRPNMTPPHSNNTNLLDLICFGSLDGFIAPKGNGDLEHKHLRCLHHSTGSPEKTVSRPASQACESLRHHIRPISFIRCWGYLHHGRLDWFKT
jgi:hypothetical protein